MKDKKIFKIVDKTKQTKLAFQNTIVKKSSSPIMKEMIKFIHHNLEDKKNIFNRLNKFKPEDIR